MKKKVGISMNLLVIVSMVTALLVAQPSAAHAQDGPVGPSNPFDVSVDALSILDDLSTETALNKIDPSLREAASARGKDLVDIYVSVQGGADLTAYLQQPIVRPAVFAGIQNIYGKTQASNLLKIASQPGVLAVVNTGGEMREKPYDPEQDEEIARSYTAPAAGVSASGGPGAQGWFDVQDGHKSKAAWQKGFTGEGVIVGILDDGIDFAHPDLQGTYAWVTDTESPYYGWPMAFSQVSTRYFAEEVLFQNQGAFGITESWAGSRWADTSTTATATDGVVTFQPIYATEAHQYKVPGTSQSGTYRLGSLPEENLLGLFGEMVAILVVDEETAGVYDTVYADLDGDFDFTNELPATKESPEIWNDLTGDGVADISGGLVAWISDGANPPPTVDWLWGITCGAEVGTLKACPDQGSLVIFAGAFSQGYTHGTQCASNVAAQGMVSGGLSEQPFRVGGMVQGAAPNVGLMDFGNHYYNGTDEDEFIVAALGYDGVPNSGDEVQITSNSYGSFTQMWGGWGYIGRLVTALNLSVAPTTVWVFSAGNEGPGFGPQEGENGPTLIKAGSSTQYGSTAWDSIMEADQIVYGDPNSFFSHGPNRDGSSGLDVLGNGGRGAGDEGLNYFALERGYFDGESSWATWGGTSRSAPVIAGNLALVYQAFHDNHGRWPRWDEVKAIIKSSATNVVSSPFYQGAGVMNADRATDVAGGLHGFYATPDEWVVGDWEGKEYLNFASVAKPGSSYSKTIEVTNPSEEEIELSMEDGVMELIDQYEFEFTTKGKANESPFNFHAPDYLIPFDDSDVPDDTEVMIVRYIQPYENYDQNGDYTTAENSWRFLFYNWTDQDGDGKLWQDENDNGAVNYVSSDQFDNDGFARIDYSQSEIDEGEYVRMDYQFGGTGIPIIIHDPIERMGDGYFFGFQHRVSTTQNSTTTFKVGVEFYKRADWDWLTLSEDDLDVEAESTAAFEAEVSVPDDAKPGIYEGVIFVNDPGDDLHGAHEAALPVVVNVIADLPDGGSVLLGGESDPASTMYQNSFTHGYFNWYGGGWTGAGDWRHYFLNIDKEDVSAKNLLVHTSWENVPTDFNTWVLGPTPDCASNGAEPCAWYQPGLGQPLPGVFGPYTLQPIASSDPFLTGATYPFHTSTGGPDDWMLAPLSVNGLHEIALHNVVYAGEDLVEPFEVEVGTLDFTAELADPANGVLTMAPTKVTSYTNSGAIHFNFTPTLSLPDLHASLAGGLKAFPYGPFTVTVVDNNQGFTAWNPLNTVVPFTVDQAGATQLTTTLHVSQAPAAASQDADLFLVWDANNNGLAEQGVDSLLGSSGNSAGTDETITISDPEVGQYLLVIAGYDVSPDSGVEMQWSYSVTAPGPMPSEAKDLFNETISISDEADAFDPETALYSQTVTTHERTGALHAALTGIPAGSDVDLYVTDSEGAIVAQSTAADNADESLAIEPVLPEYRLAPGTEYTVWVHGKTVAGTITPTLHIWEDKLSTWLTTEQAPEVSVSAIGPDEEIETAVVTLNYESTTWKAGEFMSVRLLAGPSVLPNAFDEIVTITRAEKPAPAAVYTVSMTVSTERGPSPVTVNVPAGYPPNPSVALVAPGEQLTYTVTLKNVGDATGVFLAESYWGNAAQDFVKMVEPSPANGALTETEDGSLELLWAVDELDPGETITYQYITEAAAMNLNSIYGVFIDVYEFTGNTTEPYGAYSAGDVAVAHYRGFTASTTSGLAAFSEKASDKSVVKPGETFTYTISLTNPSSVDTEVFVTDPLPATVNLVSAPEMQYDTATRTLRWNGVLPGNSLITKELVVTVKASSSAPNQTEVVNQAAVALTAGGVPVATLINTTVIDDGMYPDLAISKTVSELTAEPGDELEFQVTLHNDGEQTAYNARLLDILPDYLKLDKGSVVNGLVDDNEIYWEGDLPVGESVTVSYTAEVKGDTPNFYVIYNKAMAWADNHPAVVYSASHTEILADEPAAVSFVAFGEPFYRVKPKSQVVLDTAVDYGDVTGFADEILVDNLVSIKAPAGVNLAGMTIQAFVVAGGSETPVGSLTLAAGQTSFWMSEFGSARSSLKAEAGKSYVYRFKFTPTDKMYGEYAITTQSVAATGWNFDNPANWAAASNRAEAKVLIAYNFFMPILGR